MKILLMGFTKIKYMPYINFYLENLDSNSNEIDILYWNRDLGVEDLDKYKNYNLLEFSCYQEDEVPKLTKIKSFCKYRKFAKRILIDGQYDFVFVLHSLTGVVVYDILRKKYNNKYAFDYRDSTYEKFLPFKKLIGGLIKHSKFTFTSSDAFRKYFPKKYENKIFTSHNILTDSLIYRNYRETSYVKSDKIRVAFWGFIRNEELNKQIILQFSEDKRFELHYYGREQRVVLNLKKYVNTIGANNIFFHGEYKPQDRYDFIKETDIIHNIYFDKNMMLAMANKYYDGIIFKIPLLSFKGSFMGNRSLKAGVGFECDPYENDFTEKLYQNYLKLGREKFYKSCDIELNKILNEYYKGTEIIKDIND